MSFWCNYGICRVNMVKIEIYTTMFCGYCQSAKHLLKKKGVAFEEIDISLKPPQRAVMIERADGNSTVPQIFIDGESIGGCDELYVLDQEGKLDALLGTQVT